MIALAVFLFSSIAFAGSPWLCQKVDDELRRKGSREPIKCPQLSAPPKSIEVIVDKNHMNKHRRTYGKLKQTAYVNITWANGRSTRFKYRVTTGGKKTETTQGTFSPQSLSRNHKSQVAAWRGAPMPYSIFFNGGIALHQSDGVTGNPASGGCVRSPWLESEMLFCAMSSMMTPDQQRHSNKTTNVVNGNRVWVGPQLKSKVKIRVMNSLDYPTYRKVASVEKPYRKLRKSDVPWYRNCGGNNQSGGWMARVQKNNRRDTGVDEARRIMGQTRAHNGDLGDRLRQEMFGGR